MFRRKPRSYARIASDMVYPPGGWWRAMLYTLHRLRRLPDRPHRIARGVAAGVFVSFTPLFGFHLFVSMALAWAMGGNVLASVIGSLFGNPLTLPFIAAVSMGLGRWMLGIEGHLGPVAILDSFTAAGRQLLQNMMALLHGRESEWDRLEAFSHEILVPYLAGGLLPGLITALAFYYGTVPLVEAYHARRVERLARSAARRPLDAQQAEPLDAQSVAQRIPPHSGDQQRPAQGRPAGKSASGQGGHGVEPR